MAQAPEIEQLVGWLTDWGQPVPETMRDHVNGRGGGQLDTDDMPGMTSAKDMSALDDASDAEFQSMWLEMMIQHHEGAIDMAQAEQADGHFEPALELARSIADSQQAEVDTMEKLMSPT